MTPSPSAVTAMLYPQYNFHDICRVQFVLPLQMTCTPGTNREAVTCANADLLLTLSVGAAKPEPHQRGADSVSRVGWS